MRILVFSLLLLSGCARPQGIKVEYVDRPVIQVQKCVKKEDIPTRPGLLSQGRQPRTLDEALSLSLSKLSEWSRYGARAEILFSTCSPR